MQEDYLFEPELCGPVPRLVEISPMGRYVRRMFRRIAVFMVPFCAFFFVWGMQEGGATNHRVGGYVAFIWGIINVLLNLVVEAYLRLRLRQLRDGALAIGIVRSWRKVDSTSETIYYEFQTASGRIRRADCTVPLTQRSRCEVGQRLTIVYSPHGRAHALPYFLFSEVQIVDPTKRLGGGWQ